MIHKIPFPPNFSFNECLWFLDRDFNDCMHKIIGEKVRKLLIINGKKVLVDIYAIESELYIETIAGYNELSEELIPQIKEWFDMDREISGFYELCKNDKEFSHSPNSFAGLRLMSIPNLYEALCWSIIGQQINLTFAYKVKKAFVEALGESLEFENEKYYAFPEPIKVLKTSFEELKTMQFSGQKIKYIMGISESFESGELSKELLSQLPSKIEKLKFLTSFKGIGEWTAEYTLIKADRDLTAVPYGDTGISQALFNLKGIPKKESRLQQKAVFAGFNGWEAYLVFYLWRSLVPKL